jgi:class 3 adenylate cyclase
MPRKKVTPKREQAPRVVPVKADEHERETIIMFVDIMGASEVSNHKSLKQYWEFVNKFQDLFRRVCDRQIREMYDEEDLDFIQHTERGDEGLLMFYRPTDQAGISADIDTAINIALELKREWLCLEENSERITKSGLLPVNLAVGIHAGRTYLEKKPKTDTNRGGWLPEGYAINLAKRVESYSRQGRFTHIFLSEAAHGYLNSLPDERLYLFDSPQVFSPKGISRDIRVYEVKHHFLPSDWKEQSTSTSKRSKALLDPSCVNLEVLEKALQINPTNLWLVEEFIRSSMLSEYINMRPEQREDDKFMKRAFGTALDAANRLTQSDQRDAGALFIQGLIEGERGEYETERDRYDDAINYTDQLAEAYWYKGLSYSFQTFASVDYDLDATIDDLGDEQKGWVREAIDCFKKAKIRRSHSAWMPFDYGCEMVRWAKTEEELAEGIEQIELAVSRLDDVRYEIREQEYLQKVLSNPRIKDLLPD